MDVLSSNCGFVPFRARQHTCTCRRTALRRPCVALFKLWYGSAMHNFYLESKILSCWVPARFPQVYKTSLLLARQGQCNCTATVSGQLQGQPLTGYHINDRSPGTQRRRQRKLGPLTAPPMGLGTWAWGNHFLWYVTHSPTFPMRWD